MLVKDENELKFLKTIAHINMTLDKKNSVMP